MEGEMERIATVWISVAISLSYCYTIGRVIPKGIQRLVLFLPIVFLFLLLPLKITSANLTGMIGFFVAFLGNFKLLLFAFGKGPLVAAEASLPRFVAVGCLPIKVVRDEKANGDPNKKRHNKSVWNYVVKAVLLATLVKAYSYSDRIHPKVMLLLYCLHLYFSLEITFSVLAAIARAAFGLELEPQFNQPHLSTSLQDFWGHRWNLIVPSILRPTVHEPIRNLSARLIGPRWSLLLAILATFLVSGLMHEIMFYYSARGQPTWQMTKFFLVHGLCLVAEVAVKKAVAGRWRLPGLVSGALTIAFVASTGIWWFMPIYVEIGVDKRAIQEFNAVGEFVRNASRAILHLFQRH